MGIVVDGYPSYFDCYNEDGLGIAGLNFPHFAKFSDGPIDGKINLASTKLCSGLLKTLLMLVK